MSLEIERLIAADHTDREGCEIETVDRPLLVKFEPANPEPIAVCDGAGKVIARFVHPVHAAMFLRTLETAYWAHVPTLPEPLMRQINLWQKSEDACRPS